jgi:hypothetical protein
MKKIIFVELFLNFLVNFQLIVEAGLDPSKILIQNLQKHLNISEEKSKSICNSFKKSVSANYDSLDTILMLSDRYLL